RAPRVDSPPAARRPSGPDRGLAADRADRVWRAGPDGPDRDTAHGLAGDASAANGADPSRDPPRSGDRPDLPDRAGAAGVRLGGLARLDASAPVAADDLRALLAQGIPVGRPRRLQRPGRTVSPLAVGGPDRRLAAPAGRPRPSLRMRDPGVARRFAGE